MPLYVGKYVICAFLQNMRNILRSHDRYKPVSLVVGSKCVSEICIDLYCNLSSFHMLIMSYIFAVYLSA